MAGFYAEMERIIKANGDRGLDMVLHYYGIDLEVWRDRKTDVYSKVHSTNSGGAQEKVKCIVGCLVSDDFFPSTDASGPNFIEGFLYCKDTDIMAGDEIRVISDDNKRRAWKVTLPEVIGQTTNVFKHYKLSSIAN